MSNTKATRNGYGDALCELGAVNDKVVVLDADLAHATMTVGFSKKYPERFFNAGIAEANMVDMAAGLSTMGLIPFCSTFAIFGAGRAYEMIRNSIAYPKLNVKLCMTHAGLTVGEDGGSHQSIEDIALMRVIPGMVVISPCDANEAQKAVFALAEYNGPAYLRLYRPASHVFDGDMPFEIGKANVMAEGSDVAIFAHGLMVKTAMDAAEELATKGISAAVINMHTIKPLDRQCVEKYANSCKKIVTVEEHSVIGGLGDAVADVVTAIPDVTMIKIGVNDLFGQSGSPNELLKEYGLDKDSIVNKISEFVK